MPILSGMNRLRDALDRWFDTIPAIGFALILLILALEAVFAK